MQYFFSPEHINIIDKSVAIAEDVTSDFFAFSTSHWKRNPYEIKTLRESRSVEFPEKTYAHLLRFDNTFSSKMSGRDSHQIYHICLHDHNILTETRGGLKERLLPFMVYVISHELVHIARFSRHCCHLLSEDKEQEEQIVHSITNDMLEKVPLRGLDRVLERFAAHRSP